MTPPFGRGTTVTRLRGTVVDDGYGGEVIDWASSSSITIAGCGLAPRAEGEEHGAGRGGVIVGYTLYAPHGSDITYRDRVTTPLGTFEVEGEPGSWTNPLTGTDAGMTMALRRVEG